MKRKEERKRGGEDGRWVGLSREDTKEGRADIQDIQECRDQGRGGIKRKEGRMSRMSTKGIRLEVRLEVRNEWKKEEGKKEKSGDVGVPCKAFSLAASLSLMLHMYIWVHIVYRALIYKSARF